MEATPKTPKEELERKRIRRQSPEFSAQTTLKDSKDSNKDAGHPPPDFDLDFVKSLLPKGCEICGTKDGLIRLDRADLNLGFTKTNIVVVCKECKKTRRKRPLNLWKVAAKLDDSQDVCSDCGQVFPLEDFPVNQLGKRSQYDKRTICKTCLNKRSRSRSYRPDKIHMRMGFHAKYYDREQTLTVTEVLTLTAQACHYCESTTIPRNVDRKDCSKGYTSKNVVASCIRCNLTRGNLPYEAFKIIGQGIKEAQSLGLFGDWICKNGRIDLYGFK